MFGFYADAESASGCCFLDSVFKLTFLPTKKAKLEIWSPRPMYFAATHHSEGGGGAFHGGGTFHGGMALSMRGGTFHGGWCFPWGVFHFGPYLVDGRQGVASMGGGSAKPKVLLLAKPLELQ